MWRVLKKKNWHILEQGHYTDGKKYTLYVYNGKVYTHVGEDFPPRRVSFSLPIRKALLDGKDVTNLIKRFSGPLGTDIPLSGYIFYKKRFKLCFEVEGFRFRIFLKQMYEKGSDRKIEVQNILGHWSTLDAR